MLSPEENRALFNVHFGDVGLFHPHKLFEVAQ